MLFILVMEVVMGGQGGELFFCWGLECEKGGRGLAKVLVFILVGRLCVQRCLLGSLLSTN